MLELGEKPEAHVDDQRRVLWLVGENVLQHLQQQVQVTDAVFVQHRAQAKLGARRQIVTISSKPRRG